MSEDEIWAFVADAHTGVLTTLRRDGTPVSLPLWFACLDRRIYARTRGKKLQRIKADPRASFLVETGLRWAELKAVHLTGTVELVELDGETAARYRAETERKYGAYRSARKSMPKATADHYRRSDGGIICFVPDPRILNWDNAKLGIR